MAPDPSGAEGWGGMGPVPRWGALWKEHIWYEQVALAPRPDATSQSRDTSHIQPP